MLCASLHPGVLKGIWSVVMSAVCGCTLPGGCTRYISGTGTCHREGYYFPDIGIKNGINFQNFGIWNGTCFQNIYMKYISSDILFRKIGIRSGILFQKIGIRNGYVFEASMARPRPKSVQVHPRSTLLLYAVA